MVFGKPSDVTVSARSGHHLVWTFMGLQVDSNSSVGFRSPGQISGGISQTSITFAYRRGLEEMLSQQPRFVVSKY